jgi:hypothetical protein
MIVKEIHELLLESGLRPERKTVFVGTWMGRPGQQTTFKLESKRMGKRIVVHQFEDSDEVSLKINEGDFWRHSVPPVSYVDGTFDGGFSAEEIVKEALDSARSLGFLKAA